jgi:hypothetical protein
MAGTRHFYKATTRRTNDKLCYVKSNAGDGVKLFRPLFSIKLFPFFAEFCSWHPDLNQAPRDAKGLPSPALRQQPQQALSSVFNSALHLGPSGKAAKSPQMLV